MILPVIGWLRLVPVAKVAGIFIQCFEAELN